MPQSQRPNPRSSSKSRLTKYFLALFNLLCMITGCIFMYMGALALRGYALHLTSSLKNFPINEETVFPILLFFMGAVMFVLSVLGCCTACAQNQPWIMIYVTLLMVVQIVFIIYAAHDRKDAVNILLRTLKRNGTVY